MEKYFKSNEIEKIKQYYSATTYRNVSHMVKRLGEMINIKKFSDLNKKTAQIKRKIYDNKSFTPAVKSNYMYCIIKLLKLVNTNPSTHITEMANDLAEQKKKSQIEKRDKRVITGEITATKLYNFVKKEKKPEKVITMFSVLKSCPIRISEFRGMRWIDDGKSNYVNFKEKQLVIREHKNKSGVRYVNLNPSTLRDLKRYKAESNTLELYEGKTAKNLQDMFSTVVRLYKKKKKLKSTVKVGIHEMRGQSEVNNMKNLRSGMSGKDLEKVLKRSRELGHGLETALMYYTDHKPIE